MLKFQQNVLRHVYFKAKYVNATWVLSPISPAYKICRLIAKWPEHFFHNHFFSYSYTNINWKIWGKGAKKKSENEHLTIKIQSASEAPGHTYMLRLLARFHWVPSPTCMYQYLVVKATGFRNHKELFWNFERFYLP